MAESYDVVVIGSGAAGLMAAARAAHRGLSVLVVEKAHQWGGTSATSGGGVWIPNHGMGGEGDSRAKALTYLHSVSQGAVRQDRLEAFVDQGPVMLGFLEQLGVRLHVLTGYPDYFPDAQGAHIGRALFPYEIDAAGVGDGVHTMRMAPVRGKLFNRYSFGLDEAFALATRAPGWRRVIISIFRRYWCDVGWRKVSSRDRRLTMGNALMGGLRKALDQRGVKIELGTALADLVVRDGTVSGVELVRHERRFTVQARKGVIIAAGGFEWNQAMRDRYFTVPTPAQWSTTPERANDGIGTLAAQKIGADTEFMETGWYIPSMLMPTIGVPNTEMTHQMSFDHGRPHSVCVNRNGVRFVKETIAYDQFGLAMLKDHAESGANITVWLVFDAQFREKYSAGGFMLNAILPDAKVPRDWWGQYVYRADTIEELATKIEVDPVALSRTVRNMNHYAHTGIDTEFGRGNDDYDKFVGDARIGPNSSIGSIDKAPYYAVPVILGDMGTKGGLKADAHARVLDQAGAPIDGLYVAGNAAGSPFGVCYPGAGGTIGPAMTFGFIAAEHLAARSARGHTGKAGMPDQHERTSA
jgi:3-oxosteroid 1-dehydrogenase